MASQIKVDKSLSRNLYLKSRTKFLFPAAAVLFSWIPVFAVSFLNDDYQILGYHFNKNFFDLFDAFREPGVYSHYWRPIPDFIHGITFYFAGFEPLPFRIIGLFIYSFACIQVFRSLKILGFSDKTSLFSSIFFAVLPSHVLEAAWIADQLESLVASFLLLSFMNYMKAYRYNWNGPEQIKTGLRYLVFAGLWFSAAVMTKEVSYTGILIPLVYLIYQNNFDRRRLNRTIRDIAFGFLILIIIISYRVIFIGGTPFAAAHFDNLSIPAMLKNFFIYIPLAFFPPEILEFIYTYSNLPVIIFIVFLLLCILYFISRHLNKSISAKQSVVFSGAAWFIIFVIPALPVLMRWYVFTASIGFIWITAVLVEELVTKKLFYAVFGGLLILSCFYNIFTMFQWAETGIKMDKALNSIRRMEENISSDTLYIWGVPDKYKRVPMMKLGVEQSVEWSLGESLKSGISVFTPLRSELIDEDSKITLKEKSDSTFLFHLFKGRFLEEGGESKSVIIKEELFSKTDGIQIKIKTIKNNKGIAESFAEVRLLRHIIGDHLFYNGEEFLPIGKSN